MKFPSPGGIERNLLASRLADIAMMRPLDDLRREVSSDRVAIVRVSSPKDPLVDELARIYGAGLEEDRTPAVLDFHTQLAITEERPTNRPSARAGSSEELDAVRRFVLTRFCFAAPLTKRGVSTISESITVGRALNKDLVLRAQGVSKHHAWFEVRDGELWVTDGGSKNGTFVGGRRLLPREPTAVGAGETVTFSSVEVLPCTAEVFWALLRA